MDLATVALVVSITNGLAALTLTLIKLNDRRRIRARSAHDRHVERAGRRGCL